MKKILLRSSIAMLPAFAFSLHAANVDWTSSGGTAEAPLVITEKVTLTSSDNLYFKNASLAYVTNTQSSTLCANLYCTDNSKNSPVVFLGNLLFNGSLTASYGSITKRGDWESTNAGSFLIGQGNTGTFAFTNDTGNIIVPAENGATDSAAKGRLQTGYGNNQNVTYCQNGGNVTFNQLITGFANGAPADHAKNSKNHIVINGGKFTINGRANLGYGVNTTWFEQNGGEVSIGERLYLGKSANSTNFWSQTGGEMTVADSVYIGYNEGTVTEYRHSGGAATINTNLWIGLSADTLKDVYFEISGGAVTNKSNVQIGSYGMAGCRTEMEVTGNGLFVAENLCSVGVRGPGTLTIDGNGRVEVTNRAIYIGNEANAGALSQGEDCRLNLDGGTLFTKGVTLYSNNSNPAQRYLTFNGGTLKTTAAPEADFIKRSNILTVQVGANGGVIDTSLASVMIPCDISDVDGTSGGLTFKGGNSATVTGTLSYTGATSVELGTTLTVANRADIFDTGAGLICIVPEAADRNGTWTLLTTSGNNPFTAADLAKCSASGSGSSGVVFSLSQDGKSIRCKFRKGFIIAVF